MTTLSILVQLAGATMFLLFAVRMVQTGIDRAFGSGFRRLVASCENKPFRAATIGIFLALVLQSSAATALLAASFAAAGAIGFATGVAVALGADLGSALVVQALSFRLDWLIPLLLAAGGWMFVKTDSKMLKQAGRILLGVAFILLSLRLLREAIEPIRESAFLPAIAMYLERDYITAFIAGAALVVVMYSSVAVILMCVTLVAVGALPVGAGVSLVLGANLGSVVIPMLLTRGMAPAARRIPLANAVLRGTWALAALALVNLTPVLGYLTGFSPGQTLVNLHLVFNATLLIFLTWTWLLERPMRHILTDPPLEAHEGLAPVSALDQRVIGTPKLAQACLTRELMRMTHIIDAMARPVMECFQSRDASRSRNMRAHFDEAHKASSGIRRYSAMMATKGMSKAEIKQARAQTEYALNLETAADVIANRLLPLADQAAKGSVKFSEPGWLELVRLHEQVLENMALAFSLAIAEDIDIARRLMEEKSEVAQMERRSRKKHLKRLSEGAEVSFESSDIHLETLRGLKDLNSQIAAIAYPILHRHGQLLGSRLVDLGQASDD